jgi:hypothetical protein
MILKDRAEASTIHPFTFPGFVLICHVGKLLASPKRNLAFEAAMPTVRWKDRKHSPHFFHQSLELLKTVQMLENFEMFLLFLFRQQLSGNRRSSLTICFTALAMMCLKDDLYCLRPSYFYPPAGFYPTGSNDSFWNQNQDLFFKKFRFRLPHFRRLVDAMELKDQYFACRLVIGSKIEPMYVFLLFSGACHISADFGK